MGGSHGRKSWEEVMGGSHGRKSWEEFLSFSFVGSLECGVFSKSTLPYSALLCCSTAALLCSTLPVRFVPVCGQVDLGATGVTLIIRKPQPDLTLDACALYLFGRDYPAGRSIEAHLWYLNLDMSDAC